MVNGLEVMFNKKHQEESEIFTLKKKKKNRGNTIAGFYNLKVTICKSMQTYNTL